ncbi:phasin family protein [Piscirickettsia salmonis]|uniref:phasin family protein n=1 Tax=Piscirickettsia salmonis TaxID=1238 RepID=UPI0007C93B7E|nr:Phasin protein [Piscirickettsiaceae bacterium NZ-RLO1]
MQNDFFQQFNKAQQSFIKPAVGFQQLTNRIVERTVRQNLEIVNDCVQSWQNHFSEFQNAKKVEDLFNVQAKFATETSNKLANYAQQAMDTCIQSSKDCNSWFQDGLTDINTNQKN